MAEHWTQRLKRENVDLKTENKALKAENEKLASDNLKSETAEWHPQVYKKYAIQEGLKPKDFEFEQWNVSNVRIAMADKTLSRALVLAYHCDIPIDTPQANQYTEVDGNYTPIPDPVGMCLASVEFQLIEAYTGRLLHEDARDHMKGKCLGFLTEKAFSKIGLEVGESIDVQLLAYPLFFYLNAEGGARMDLCNTSNGYFKGQEALSRVYTLSMNEDGSVSI